MQAPRCSLLLICALVGCAASTPKTSPKEPKSLAKSTEPASSAATAEAAAEAAPAIAPPKAPRPEPAQDYDMTYRDCSTLAAVYRRAWLKHELKGLAKKETRISEKREAAIRRAADEAGANWEQACAQTVGSPRIRKHLVCASKAKSLQRFNDCLDGQVK